MILFGLLALRAPLRSDLLGKLGLHHVVYRRLAGKAGCFGPESIVWDPSGSRLGVLLYDPRSTGTTLWLWPSGRRIKLPDVGGYEYIRWSRDARQIAAGGEQGAAVVDTSSGKSIQRRSGVVDAAWVNGGWRFLAGSWPDIDYLPGTTDSVKIKRVGTRIPTAIDRGAGSISFRVSNRGFIAEYLPPNSGSNSRLQFGPPQEEIDARPYCAAMPGWSLIGMRMRSVDGYQLYSYRQHSVKLYSFAKWRHLGRTARASDSEVVLNTMPAPVAGHVIACGYLLGESAVNNNLGGIIVDFSSRTLRELSGENLSACSSGAAGNVALIDEKGTEATLIIARP